MGEYWRLLLAEEQPGGHPADAKRELARRLVATFWDAGSAGAAEERFDQVHVRHEIPEDVDEAEVKRVWIGANDEVHLPLLMASEFEMSTSEARRLIAQGGVRIDGEALAPNRLDVPLGELTGKVLQVGKRRFVAIKGPRG
jgi:tyrosyl-tRNA synthetase